MINPDNTRRDGPRSSVEYVRKAGVRPRWEFVTHRPNIQDNKELSIKCKQLINAIKTEFGNNPNGSVAKEIYPTLMYKEVLDLLDIDANLAMSGTGQGINIKTVSSFINSNEFAKLMWIIGMITNLPSEIELLYKAISAEMQDVLPVEISSVLINGRKLIPSETPGILIVTSGDEWGFTKRIFWKSP